MEYDAAFTALERDAQGKAEQQVGTTIVAAEEPDWRQVVKQSSALLSSTKDLRVAMHLTRALLRSSGYAGFAQGLAVLHGLVDKFWDHVHPQLDPDDDNDPTMRFNVLGSLADMQTTVAAVRKVPLASVRGLGSVSLRQYGLASGELTAAADEETPGMSLLEATFMQAPLEEFEAVTKAARAAVTELDRLDKLLMSNAQGAAPPSLLPLREALVQAAKITERFLAQRTGAAPEGALLDETSDGAPQVGGATGMVAMPQAIAGEVNSREDVIRVLEKICAYYDKNEPSSPLPLLLKRCKRLVNKSFLDIIRDMAPDGLGQVETIRGPEEQDGY
jgi:type VI secretion system protein ImpA